MASKGDLDFTDCCKAETFAAGPWTTRRWRHLPPSWSPKRPLQGQERLRLKKSCKECEGGGAEEEANDGEVEEGGRTPNWLLRCVKYSVQSSSECRNSEARSGNSPIFYF